MSRGPAATGAASTRSAAGLQLGSRRATLGVPHLFLVAGLLAVLVYATSVAVLPRRYGHIVGGDGIHYYVYLRSLVLDGNLDFTDEYTEFNRAITDPGKQINTAIRTPTGLALNMFAVGPALAALPLFLAAHGLSLAGRAVGLPLPTDGYGPVYEGAFALSGVIAGVLAAACAYAALRRWLPRWPALVGVAGIWLGGSLLYYTIASPVYAHSYSALGVAAWLLAWTRLDTARPRAWLGLGALGGLMATMRWQEGMLALLPMLLFAYDIIRGRYIQAGTLPDGLAGTAQPGFPHPRPLPGGEGTGLAPAGGGAGLRPPLAGAGLPSPRGRGAGGEGIPARHSALGTPLAYGLGLLLGFAPQMAVWAVLFGAPLAVPQGSSFFTWRDPHWLDVLFSTRNGLFTWTPVALLAIAGLLLMARRHPRPVLVALLAILSQVLVNGLLADWWAGAAFGARRFSGAAAFLALGFGWFVAMLWPARRRLALGLVTALIILNGLLLVQYSAFLKGWTTMDTYPTLRQLTIERFTWPFTYLARDARR